MKWNSQNVGTHFWMTSPKRVSSWQLNLMLTRKSTVHGHTNNPYMISPRNHHRNTKKDAHTFDAKCVWTTLKSEPRIRIFQCYEWKQLYPPLVHTKEVAKMSQLAWECWSGPKYSRCKLYKSLHFLSFIPWTQNFCSVLPLRTDYPQQKN